MAKAGNMVFFCKECGYESSKWMGQCPGCKVWNSFVTEPVLKKAEKPERINLLSSKPSTLNDIDVKEGERITTGFGELDRVLGGGVVTGSLVLVGGDPGIGKSTLLLQVCKNISDSNKKILYISGEESLKQIKLRADRVGSFSDNLLLLCETDLEKIIDTIKDINPDSVIIDSIQTMSVEMVNSAPGSVSQVRESTARLMQVAKGLQISIFIVGHVTKDGTIAGPRMLEHMVDTVLYFEGDSSASYRILRSVKNRFGSTNEIGVFEMLGNGLREVENPSEFMLSGKPENSSGSIVTCSIEGTRPILLEIQALVTRSNFGMPRRTAAGTDYNRVNLLMAVLEKRMGLRLSECDAYVNIAGGIKVNEPSLDLGIIMALVSSYKEAYIESDTIVFGEIGLSGEVRGVNMVEKRVMEAMKLGFKKCILPHVNLSGFKNTDKIELIGIKNVKQAIDILT